MIQTWHLHRHTGSPPQTKHASPSSTFRHDMFCYYPHYLSECPTPGIAPRFTDMETSVQEAESTNGRGTARHWNIVIIYQAGWMSHGARAVLFEFQRSCWVSGTESWHSPLFTNNQKCLSLVCGGVILHGRTGCTLYASGFTTVAAYDRVCHHNYSARG